MSREVHLATTKHIRWTDSKPIDSEIHSHFAPCVWPPKTSITIHIRPNLTNHFYDLTLAMNQDYGGAVGISTPPHTFPVSHKNADFWNITLHAA